MSLSWQKMNALPAAPARNSAPKFFTVNETLGFAQVMNPSGAPADKIQEAVNACPVNCIHWADEPE